MLRRTCRRRLDPGRLGMTTVARETCALIEYRAFRNTDPPQLAEIWRSNSTSRGLMQPMSTAVFERFVLSKPTFDRQGLVVAVDEDKIVGFAHAGFGPTEDRRADLARARRDEHGDAAARRRSGDCARAARPLRGVPDRARRQVALRQRELSALAVLLRIVRRQPALGRVGFRRAVGGPVSRGRISPSPAVADTCTAIWPASGRWWTGNRSKFAARRGWRRCSTRRPKTGGTP